MDRKLAHEILCSNTGFKNPEIWIEHAIVKNFNFVKADQLNLCPDCNKASFDKIAQYVYYSNLAELLVCKNCSLVFSNLRIDSKIISEHFESSYKDESYFLNQRRLVFNQIAEIASSYTPSSKKVLDIGGATGHQLSILSKKRPDLDYTLNDLSEKSCSYVESNHKFKTICGGIEAIEKNGEIYNTIILSDVIYYESEIKKLWTLLSKITAEDGTVIIRIPNKYFLIRILQKIKTIISSKEKMRLQTKVKFFNPEHIFIFTKKYLKTRLLKHGFNQVEFLPSELLDQKGYSNLIYKFCKIVHRLSLGTIILTPSLIVVANKK